MNWGPIHFHQSGGQNMSKPASRIRNFRMVEQLTHMITKATAVRNCLSKMTWERAGRDITITQKIGDCNNSQWVLQSPYKKNQKIQVSSNMYIECILCMHTIYKKVGMTCGGCAACSSRCSPMILQRSTVRMPPTNPNDH